MITKIIAMYLPQYHEIEDNNQFWGKGFTDWVSVKSAKSLYTNHSQPRVPLNNNYYDLSNVDTIKWQVDLAKSYGIHGFGFYHYWFSSEKNILTRPSELLLAHEEIDMPFMFAWDNISWKRTWSRIKGNDWAPLRDIDSKNHGNSPELLIEYKLGNEEEWKAHFEYLLPFFKDKRYIKNNNKPIFIIYHYSKDIYTMACFWDVLAKEQGFSGIEIIYKYDALKSIPDDEFIFYYEPIYSGWSRLLTRVSGKVKGLLNIKSLEQYSYDDVWKNLLMNARENDNPFSLYGAFVSYDDTPRRGSKGKVILNSDPNKFEKYFSQLICICEKQKKEYIFLTAWNEWGEGAYLEPDTINGYGYLEAIKNVLNKYK